MNLDNFNSGRAVIVTYLALMAAASFWGAKEGTDYESFWGLAINAVGLFALVFLGHVVLILPAMVLVIIYKISGRKLPEDMPKWASFITTLLGFGLFFYSVGHMGSAYHLYEKYVLVDKGILFIFSIASVCFLFLVGWFIFRIPKFQKFLEKLEK